MATRCGSSRTESLRQLRSRSSRATSRRASPDSSPDKTRSPDSCGPPRARSRPRSTRGSCARRARAAGRRRARLRRRHGLARRGGRRDGSRAASTGSRARASRPRPRTRPAGECRRGAVRSAARGALRASRPAIGSSCRTCSSRRPGAPQRAGASRQSMRARAYSWATAAGARVVTFSRSCGEHGCGRARSARRCGGGLPRHVVRAPFSPARHKRARHARTTLR